MTAALHELANTVDCPKKPRGCSAPAGQPCVNWTATREAGAHPPATRIPHTARMQAAQIEVPQQRQLEPVPAYDGDGIPWPAEPADDEEGW